MQKKTSLGSEVVKKCADGEGDKSFLPLRRKEKTLFEASGKARVCVCSLFSRV